MCATQKLDGISPKPDKAPLSLVWRSIEIRTSAMFDIIKQFTLSASQNGMAARNLLKLVLRYLNQSQFYFELLQEFLGPGWLHHGNGKANKATFLAGLYPLRSTMRKLALLRLPNQSIQAGSAT